MFKSVLVIIAVIIMLFVIRSVLQRLKQSTAKPSPLISHDTVQCLQCKTYVPCNEAITLGDKAFCSQKHLNDWNQAS